MNRGQGIIPRGDSPLSEANHHGDRSICHVYLVPQPLHRKACRPLPEAKCLYSLYRLRRLPWPNVGFAASSGSSRRRTVLKTALRILGGNEGSGIYQT